MAAAVAGPPTLALEAISTACMGRRSRLLGGGCRGIHTLALGQREVHGGGPNHLVCKVVDNGEHHGVESGHNKLATLRGEAHKNAGHENEKEESSIESNDPVHGCIYSIDIFLDCNRCS
jgi:hypothetical protein